MASVVGVVMSASLARAGPILAGRWTALGRLGVWALAWAVAVACAFVVPLGRRAAVGVVLAVGVAVRVAAMAGPPTLSDDLYRYSWDGRVQAAGVNPYRYAPDASALAGLREPWLWPDSPGCAALARPEGCTRINRPSEPTIYPPVAQVWFSAVYRLAGIEARHKAWQAAGLVTELALLALLPVTLAAWGRDRRWTALYALSPLGTVEVVNNGHVEGLAALLVVAALLLAAKRRAALAGAVIGMATLVKLYPALLVVGLVGVAGVTSRRRLGPLVMAAASALAVAAVGYLAHVAEVGPRVLGYLPGYLREERYDEGDRFLLAGLAGLSGGLAAVAAVAAMMVVACWVLVRRPEPPRAFAGLVGTLLLAVTPVQPWYAVTLLAAATVAGLPAWSAVALAGYPYFFAVILDSPAASAVGRLSYGLALSAIAVAALDRWRRRHGRNTSDG